MTDAEKLKAAKDLIDFIWKNASMSRLQWIEATIYLEIYHHGNESEGDENEF